MSSTETLKNPARRLPDLSLPEVGSGATRRVRGSGRGAPVVLLLHGFDCTDCQAYLDRLAARRAELGDWDGELIVVLPTAEPGREEEGAWAPLVLHDDDARLARRLGVKPPAVVIADRWGEIRLLDPAGDNHAFHDPDEIVAWLRFIAIECPECQGEAY